MPARTTRKEARERLLKTIAAAVDRVIPEDESVPLKGSTFAEWEDQGDAFKREVLPTLLEERAALEENARVESGGRCPHCCSGRVYLEKQTTSPEVLSPDGPRDYPKEELHPRQRVRDTLGGRFRR